MQYKKFFLLISYLISIVTLSSCGFNKDFDKTFQELEALFEEPVQKPKPQPSFKSTSKGKPVHLVPTNYKSKAKKLPVKKPSQILDTKPKISTPKIPITTPACNLDLFLSQSNISNLYKTYMTENKSCIAITNPKIAQHFASILAENYSSQDVRILNADESFLMLYATAIKSADAPEKLALNKQILNHGCHLLKINSCALIKNHFIRIFYIKLRSTYRNHLPPDGYYVFYDKI